jgi:signal transduction histidine kinase
LLFHHSPILVLSVHAIGILVAVFFGVLALFHDSKSATNRALAILMLGTVLWDINNFLIFASTSAAFTIFIARTQMVFATMQIFSTLLFVYTFPKSSISPKKWQVVLFSVAAISALAMSPFLFNLDINNLYPATVIPISKASSLDPPWGIIFSVVVFLTVFIAFRRYRAAKKEEKAPFAAVLFGMVSTFILLFITQYLLINVFGIIDFNFYGPLFLMPLVIGTGYAIVKHHLFNIKTVATEILIFSTWMILFIRVFFEKSIQSAIVDLVILSGVVVVGIFLIKSVLNEVRQKEKLAELNTRLDKVNAELTDLNDHLEQKVAAQTQEIKRAYEVEKKARTELEELDKAKDQFILTTQHHLRTPLTIAKGYLQSFITKKFQLLDEEGKTFINKVQESTDKIASLVNEFLDISQMEVGKSIINRQLIKPKDVIQDIITELEPEITKKKLSVDTAQIQDATLSADPQKLGAALTNLLDNSVKYNHEGGSITIKGEKIRHPIERDKEIYRLTIEDTGMGLTAEELAHLFTQYFQRGKEAEKVNTTGRGIGLVVTKNIIQAHQGRIYAESEGRGRGARFVVELPFVQV